MANGLLWSRIWALAGLICLVSLALSEGFQPPQRVGVAARLRQAQDLGRDHAYGADPACKGSHKSALRLRGGGIFTKLDDAGASCFGKSLWGFLKTMMGLSSKPKNSPEEDLAELQVDHRLSPCILLPSPVLSLPLLLLLLLLLSSSYFIPSSFSSFSSS